MWGSVPPALGSRGGPATGRGRGPDSRCPAREIREEELQRFASRVAAVLQGPELGPEAADCLQRLHLTVAATKYPRK